MNNKRNSLFLTLMATLFLSLGHCALTEIKADPIKINLASANMLTHAEALAKMEGKPLKSEKLESNVYEWGLKAALAKKGFKSAVELFKHAIGNHDLLKEAVFHTNAAKIEAIAEIMDLQQAINAVSNASNNDKNSAFALQFQELLTKEHLLNVKRGLRLVIEALQQYAISKGYLNKDGKPNLKGKVFIATVSVIIKCSLQWYNLHQDSIMLTILNGLNKGTEGVKNALEQIEKSWTVPTEAIRLLSEVVAFINDICFDVPETRVLPQARSADEFFDHCNKMLAQERAKHPVAASGKAARA